MACHRVDHRSRADQPQRGNTVLMRDNCLEEGN